MNYLAYTFSNPNNEALKDMLVELLGTAGFDSFIDVDDGFTVLRHLLIMKS